MDKKNLVGTLVGCGLIWTSGAIFGNMVRECRDRKKKENLDRAMGVLLSVYKDGVKFSDADVEFLKMHGFDGKYMFR